MGMKQHEVLAIEHDKKQKATLILGEALHTFEKKPALFAGHRKSYAPFDSEDVTKQIPAETVDVQNTVLEKVEYVENFLADKIDIILTKEMTNAGTKAALMIGGKQVELNAPALLALEKEVVMFRDFLRKAPTLPNDMSWTPSQSSQGIWETSKEETIRTTKTQKPVTMYPHTDKHPAQTQLITEDVAVGKWSKQLLSGALSTKQKADMLNRADAMINDIQQARARANDTEANFVKLGKLMLDSIIFGK